MKRSYFMIVTLMICLLWIVSCFAEEKKNDLINPSYDFKQMKTVIVQYSIDDGLILSDAEKRNLENIFNNSFFNNKAEGKIQFTSMAQAEEMIEKSTGLNMKELCSSDTLKYNEALQKNLPTVADAILKIKIIQHETNIKHMPDTTQRYVEYEQYTRWVTRYDYQGHYAGQNPIFETRPVYKDRVIPGYDMSVGSGGTQFVLLTIMDQQEIMKWDDTHTGNYKLPDDMIRIIFDRAKERLAKVVKDADK